MKIPLDIKAYFVWVILVTLTACAVFDVHKPETYEDKLAYVQSGILEAQAKLKQKILAGSITKKDALNVDGDLDNLAEGSQIAIDLRAAGDPNAQAKLESIRGGLLAVRTYLGI